MLSFAAWNACCQRGEWSHFINLSGQDFPLKPQKQIIAFLNANLDREFIKVMDQHRDRLDTMHRISEYVVELLCPEIRSDG